MTRIDHVEGEKEKGESKGKKGIYRVFSILSDW